MKKILSIPIIISVIFTVLIVASLNISAANSGKCGNNLTWSYNTSTQTLTISGTGAMYDYSYSSYYGEKVTTAPWREYYNSMKTVIISDGVTTIGEHAFDDCTGLTSVTIPDSVTSIGNDAFRGCTGLTSITIPNSVTTIGGSAFYNCSGLTSVTIGNSVTSIGYYAFYNCTGLTSVAIGNSVTSIGYAAFQYCYGLTSVTIGNSVTTIGEYAFDHCYGLTSIEVDFENQYYSSIDGVLFSKDKTILVCYPCGKSGSYEIPNSVTTIGSYAFYYCTGLTEVTIPNSVTSIGYGAFRDCTGLTSVTIPDSVTSIGDGAFYGCDGLTSVTIPDSVTTIGSYAFIDCTGLTSVTIGNSVTSIGDSAFYGCNNLKTVYTPKSSKWSYKFGSGVKVIYICKVNFVGDYEDIQTVEYNTHATLPIPPYGYTYSYTANGKAWNDEAITEDITITVILEKTGITLSSACDVLSMLSPAGGKIDNENNTISGLRVTNKFDSVTVDAEVSPGATWDLYYTQISSTPYPNKTIALNEGRTKTAYIRVVAQDGTTKTYSISIYRQTKSSAPSISETGGIVTITAAENSTITYTTDNTEPSEFNGNVYTAPFQVPAGTIIKAVAKQADMDEYSDIVSLKTTMGAKIIALEDVYEYNNKLYYDFFIESDKSVSGTALIGIYDADGRLLASKIIDHLSDESEKEIFGTLPYVEYAYSYKVFLWNDTSSIMPITNVIDGIIE